MAKQFTTPTTAWAVIRYSADGYSYIDIDSIDCLRELTEKRAAKTEKECGPSWTKANARGKIVAVTISIQEV